MARRVKQSQTPGCGCRGWESGMSNKANARPSEEPVAVETQYLASLSAEPETRAPITGQWAPCETTPDLGEMGCLGKRGRCMEGGSVPEPAVTNKAKGGRVKFEVPSVKSGWTGRPGKRRVAPVMGGSVKRSAPPEPAEGLAMATFPCARPSPRPSALTLPPGCRLPYADHRDFAFALGPAAAAVDRSDAVA